METKRFCFGSEFDKDFNFYNCLQEYSHFILFLESRNEKGAKYCEIDTTTKTIRVYNQCIGLSSFSVLCKPMTDEKFDTKVVVNGMNIDPFDNWVEFKELQVTYVDLESICYAVGEAFDTCPTIMECYN